MPPYFIFSSRLKEGMLFSALSLQSERSLRHVAVVGIFRLFFKQDVQFVSITDIEIGWYHHVHRENFSNGMGEVFRFSFLMEAKRFVNRVS
jgi:hypothetical protein